MKKIFLGLVLLVLAGCNRFAPDYTNTNAYLPSALNTEKLKHSRIEYLIYPTGIGDVYYLSGDSDADYQPIKNSIRQISTHFSNVQKSYKFAFATALYSPRKNEIIELVEKRNDKNIKGAHSSGLLIIGFSNISTEDAKIRSNELCNIMAIERDSWRNFCLEFHAYNLEKILNITTKPNNLNENKTSSRNQEDEYERYLKQCEQIGFKRNTEKIGECALKIKDIEAKIQISNSQISNSQTTTSQSSQQQNIQTTQSQNNSTDTLANLVILNEAIKLMNPPKRNFNCQARPFGIYTNVYCN
jgi:hypothetical protein